MKHQTQATLGTSDCIRSKSISITIVVCCLLGAVPRNAYGQIEGHRPVFKLGANPLEACC
jgi:hypothetical protein